MEIALLTVGKTSVKYVQEGVDDYLKRLKHYIGFTMTCIPDLKKRGKLTPERQKSEEGERILAMVQPSDYVMLLDERGFECGSEGFAGLLQKQMSSGLKRLVFVIGGPYGFSEEVYARADRKMSLSQMTFSHEMIRLLFVEQVYRAMTILAGEPYHHR